MARIWSSSSFFEKIRIIMFIVLVYLMIMAYFFPAVFVRSSSGSFENQCASYDGAFTGKFIVLTGEAIPICSTN